MIRACPAGGVLMAKRDAASERRGAKKLVLYGGKRPQLRQAGKTRWSNRTVRAFFAALADSCNVKLAAERAGISTSAIYERRGKDASFRAGWDKALAEGYAKLELIMLERALHGVEKTIVLKNGETTTMREYSDRLGLMLLKMHRENVTAIEEDIEPNDAAEAAERILARLDRLAEREGTEIENKAAPDRLELIRSGIRRNRLA